MKKQFYIGNVPIGDGSVSIQSMTNVPFTRFDELKTQALALEKEGCQIIRASVPDRLSAERFADLKKAISVPLVADIHFDYRLALASIEAGADKIRINPGNIGAEHIKEVAHAAYKENIPIRVGVNAGSLEKDLLAKFGHPCAEALALSAYNNVRLLENCGFEDIVVSMKASDVRVMVSAYRLFAEKYNDRGYPLHVGVTEAGTLRTGTVKSAVGIGALLLDGIGDTIRVSLTADPVEEVRTAKTLLRSLGIRKSGIEVISCPTCGRTTVDSVALATRIEDEFSDIETPIKIAVMGCVVNGIGEAGEADFGVTGANGKYVLFKDGKTVKKDISENEVFGVIKEQIEKIVKEGKK